MIIKIFLVFLKIGFLGFGGGYAMLSLIYHEASKFGMTMAQFADMNALDGIIPGPIAINSATYVGQMYGGFCAALVATVAVSVPSMIFVPLYVKYEAKINNNYYLNQILSCIKAASVGLIFAVAFLLILSIGLNVENIFNWQHLSINYTSLGIIVLVIFIYLRYEINPIILILASGLLGGLVYLI